MADDEREQHEGIHTRALGEYIAGAHDLVLPSDLTERMQLLALDTIGCSLLASELPWSLRLIDTMRATEMPGPSLIWGHDCRFSPAIAAMVNGAEVHGFETDDLGPGGHSGSVTTTVALALAEGGAELSGLDLLRAEVLGLEVAARVSDCVGSVPHTTNGFHGPGLFGTFGAVAAASFVLGLDAEQTVSAIGHAAQFAGGLMGTHHGGMGKRLLQGKAAHSGTLAAQLAANGFDNVPNIFECGYGSFPFAFSGARVDSYDLTKLSAGLGEEFRAYGASFKMWSARVPIHPSLEAIKAIRAERELKAEEVESVDVPVPLGTFQNVGWPYVPTTITSAQLNLQYCLAVMLLDDQVFVEQFTEERIRSAEVLALVDRIHVRHDPALDALRGDALRAVTLEITLKSGEKLRSSGKQRMASNNPVTRDEVIEKFHRVSERRLSASQRDEMVALCMSLEKLPDARELLGPLELAG